MTHTTSKQDQDSWHIRNLCRKRDKIESAMHSIIAACDEALAAHDAGLPMDWYETNIALATSNALRLLGLPKKSQKKK